MKGTRIKETVDPQRAELPSWELGEVKGKVFASVFGSDDRPLEEIGDETAVLRIYKKFDPHGPTNSAGSTQDVGPKR